MKSFNKQQWIFLIVVSLPIVWMIATVAVYPLNGIGVKGIYKSYRFGMLWQVLTGDNIRFDIRLSAIKALGIGFLGSIILFAVALLSGNKTKSNLYGDAKFASESDIRRSKVVTWGGRVKRRRYHRQIQRQTH